jgi:nitroreductase
MTKDAKTTYDILKVLKKRYSPRAFSTEAVDEEFLNKMLEAARWAPSASNEQPWRFIIGVKQNTNSETYSKIFNSLVEFNQIWCKRVPLLIVVCTFKFSKSGDENKYRFYDAGQAAAHLTFQAVSDGLFVHQMAGFDKKKISEDFHLPDEIEPFTTIAVGHLGNYLDLPERMQRTELAERERKSFDDIIITY